MKIQDNILKFYLKNCYFITGTAYAGKSTMCSMLSKKYNMLHCEENYNMDTILSAVDEQNQPNLNYFNTMPSWQHYVSRTPKEFYDWYNSVSEEVAEFEVAELIRLSGDRKVIVDTNIPLDTLLKIAEPNHVGGDALTAKYVCCIVFQPRRSGKAVFAERDQKVLEPGSGV